MPRGQAARNPHRFGRSDKRASAASDFALEWVRAAEPLRNSAFAWSRWGALHGPAPHRRGGSRTTSMRAGRNAAQRSLSLPALSLPALSLPALSLSKCRSVEASKGPPVASTVRPAHGRQAQPPFHPRGFDKLSHRFTRKCLEWATQDRVSLRGVRDREVIQKAPVASAEVT
jgi:hypothetical protein